MTPITNDRFIATCSEENHAVFHARFWRCYRLLDVIAARVLGGRDRASDAVENCWLTASRNVPGFEGEGAFRSWLVRIVIDEALVVLREARKRSGCLPITKPIRTMAENGLRRRVLKNVYPAVYEKHGKT